LFCLAFLMVGMVSHADSLSDKQAAIEQEKEEIQEKLENQQEILETNQNKIAAIEKEKDARQSEIDKMEADLEHIFEAIAQIDVTIADAERQYNEKLALLKERSLIMYQNANYSKTQMFIQSESLLDFLNRQSYYNAFLKSDMELLEEVSALKQELENKKRLQVESKANIETLKAEKEALLSNLESEAANPETLSASTKALIAELEKQEEEMRVESDRIAALIQSSSSSSSSSNVSYGGGPLLWPAAASRYISSYFGMRMHPIYHYMRMHNGIDIAAAGGTDILAAEAGTVIVSSYNSGYGNYIVVDHGGGISTLYAHASRRIAGVGDHVSRGQVIALVGTTGNSTGNHLHFEVRKNGNPVNPLNYL